MKTCVYKNIKHHIWLNLYQIFNFSYFCIVNYVYINYRPGQAHDGLARIILILLHMDILHIRQRKEEACSKKMILNFGSIERTQK